jgi:hypothetical protein
MIANKLQARLKKGLICGNCSTLLYLQIPQRLAKLFEKNTIQKKIQSGSINKCALSSLRTDHCETEK